VDLNPVRWWEEATADGRPRTKPTPGAVRREWERRGIILTVAKGDRDFRARMIAQCEADPVFLANNFVWVYDPRDSKQYAMVLWQRQVDYIRFLQDMLDRQQTFMVEKSRDAGVTYLNCLFAIHRWRFHPGFKTSFCANKQELVDMIGDPDSIFEKMRMMLESLPTWLLPRWYDRYRFALHRRILNPENRNVIIGNSGHDAGRGGRSSWYVIDEAAHLDNADAVDLATSANTRVRAWCSSVNGIGNFFARKKTEGRIPCFTMHWRDDPRKDEAWAIKERAELGKEKFAQEFDIDYAASLTGMVVEKIWVDAAVELWKMLPHPDHDDRYAGMDVAAGGRDISVFQPRIGHLLPKAHSRSEGDTTDTAGWGLELAHRFRVKKLVYDNIGVGEGVHSTLKRGVVEEPFKGIKVIPCNWGMPPTGGRRWEDGRTSQQRFKDIKAELAWIMRTRFRNSYELHLHLTGQEGGVAHEPSDCLLLEPSPDLQAQLPTVKWQYTESGGKIEIESKKALKARGVKSPDFWDALAYSFFDRPTVNLRQGIIVGERTAATLEW
jgi:phage terminase large subunit